MDECTDGRAGGWAHIRTDGWAGAQIDAWWADEWADRRNNATEALAQRKDGGKASGESR